MLRLGPVSLWSHGIWVICVVCDVYILANCPEDGAPHQKRQKASIPSPRPHIGDGEYIPMLATGSWRADQEVVAPIDDDNMIDFNYDINGLTVQIPRSLF